VNVALTSPVFIPILPLPSSAPTPGASPTFATTQALAQQPAPAPVADLVSLGGVDLTFAAALPATLTVAAAPTAAGNAAGNAAAVAETAVLSSAGAETAANTLAAERLAADSEATLTLQGQVPAQPDPTAGLQASLLLGGMAQGSIPVLLGGGQQGPWPAVSMEWAAALVAYHFQQADPEAVRRTDGADALARKRGQRLAAMKAPARAGPKSATEEPSSAPEGRIDLLD
jgi:hypothetical protein